MNPKDAERLGLKQGDWVWIETPWGQGPRGARFVLRHFPGAW